MCEKRSCCIVAVGFVAALELVEEKASKKSFDPLGAIGKRAVKACLEEGLIVRAIMDSIALCPPLIMTEPELDEMFDKLDRALDRLL